MFIKVVDKVLLAALLAMLTLIAVVTFMTVIGMQSLKAEIGALKATVSVGNSWMWPEESDYSEIQMKRSYVTLVDVDGSVGTLIYPNPEWYKVLSYPNGGGIYHIQDAHLYPLGGLTTRELEVENRNLLILADPGDTITLEIAEGEERTYLDYSSCAQPANEDCRNQTTILLIRNN